MIGIGGADLGYYAMRRRARTTVDLSPRFFKPGAMGRVYESPTTPTASRERQRPESCDVAKRFGPLLRRFTAPSPPWRRRAVSELDFCSAEKIIDDRIAIANALP